MKQILIAAALAAAGLSGSAHAAGLEGDQVTVALTIGGFPAFLCAGCTQNFTVGPGSEGAIYNNTQAVDFGAYSFSIASNGSYSQFGFNPAPADRPVTLLLSGLDFGSALTGVTFTTTLTGPVTTVVGSNSVQFTWFDQPVIAQTYLTAQFQTAAVPEPATYGMLMAGIGAVGFMVRRRRRV